MNATAYPSNTFGARTRHTGALLGHAASGPMRVLAVVIALLFGGLATFVLVAVDKPERVGVALFLAGLAVAALWGIWFSRLVVLHAEARQARMPGVAEAIGGTLATVLLATVVVPGLLMALAAVRPTLAIAALTLAACAGVLIATLPRILYLAMCFVPVGIGLLLGLWERFGPASGLALPFEPSLDQLGWLVPPALALAAWRWFAVVRQAGEAAPSPWWQPAITAQPSGGGSAMGWFSGEANGHLPDWMWPSGQTGGAGPDNPVRAMRALLGTPFAPLSGGQILVQLAAAAVCFAYLVLSATRDGGDPSVLVGGAIGGGSVLILMYGQRLEAMFRKRAAEPDEFALLPGFGQADRQRARLLAAVGWSPAWATAALVVLLPGIGLMMNLATWRVGLLLMAALGMALMTALACMRPLAGLRLDAWRMLLIAGPGLLLAMVTIVYATRAESGGAKSQLLTLLWVLGYAAGGLALASAFRRFRGRPHPFVQG